MRRMSNERRWNGLGYACAAAIVCALSMTACGGDDDDGTTTGGTLPGLDTTTGGGDTSTATTCTTDDECGLGRVCDNGTCADAPDTAGTGDTAGEEGVLKVEPDLLQWSGVSPGSPTPQSVRLLNTGTTDVEIKEITFSATTSSEYKLDPSLTLPFTLGAGLSKSFEVILDPQNNTKKDGELVIRGSAGTTDLGDGLYESRVTLEATYGANPAMDCAVIYPNAANPLNGSTVVDFGYVKPGTFKELGIVCANPTTDLASVLQIARTQVSGSNFFSTPTPVPAWVNAEGADLIKVTCAPPTDAGPVLVQGQLQISGAGVKIGEQDYFFQLICSTVQGATCDLSRDSVDFGDVVVSQTARERVQMTNPGNDTLKLFGSKKIPNADPDAALSFEYALQRTGSDPNAPLDQVASRSIADIALQFTPIKTGFVETTVEFTCNDGFGTDLCGGGVPCKKEYLTMTGRGVNPELTVTPDTCNFEEVVVGNTARCTVKMENNTVGTAQVTDVVFANGTLKSGPFSVISKPGLTEGMLGQGQSTTATIEYRPTAQGQSLDQVFVKTALPKQPEIPVQLSGVGVKCEDYCTLDNALSRCAPGSGECQLIECKGGFEDINQDIRDGCECEVILQDADNVCSAGPWLGQLGSSGGLFATGRMVKSDDTADWYKFFVNDSKFTVEIDVDIPPDSDLTYCVYYKERRHTSDCAFTGGAPVCWNGLSPVVIDGEGLLGLFDTNFDFAVEVKPTGEVFACEDYIVSVRRTR
jgi:hypothetical protein